MTTLEGTLFLVDGTWYIRSLGGAGVLTPLDADNSITVKLESGKLARIAGRLESDHRGCLRKVHATGVEVFG